jgi:hypothetical protein
MRLECIYVYTHSMDFFIIVRMPEYPRLKLVMGEVLLRSKPVGCDQQDSCIQAMAGGQLVPVLYIAAICQVCSN